MAVEEATGGGGDGDGDELGEEGERGVREGMVGTVEWGIGRGLALAGYVTAMAAVEEAEDRAGVEGVGVDEELVGDTAVPQGRDAAKAEDRLCWQVGEDEVEEVVVSGVLFGSGEGKKIWGMMGMALRLAHWEVKRRPDSFVPLLASRQHSPRLLGFVHGLGSRFFGLPRLRPDGTRQQLACSLISHQPGPCYGPFRSSRTILATFGSRCLSRTSLVRI